MIKFILFEIRVLLLKIDHSILKIKTFFLERRIVALERVKLSVDCLGVKEAEQLYEGGLNPIKNLARNIKDGLQHFLSHPKKCFNKKPSENGQVNAG